jgi:hypothetical protein
VAPLLDHPVPGWLVAGTLMINLATGERRVAPVPGLSGSNQPMAVAAFAGGTVGVDVHGRLAVLAAGPAEVAFAENGRPLVLSIEAGPGPAATSVLRRLDPTPTVVAAVAGPCHGLVLIRVPVTRCGDDLVALENGVARRLAPRIDPVGRSGDGVVGLDARRRLVTVGLDGALGEVAGSSREVVAAVPSPDGRFVLAVYGQGDMVIADIGGGGGTLVIGVSLPQPSNDRIAWSSDSGTIFLAAPDRVVAIDRDSAHVRTLRGVTPGPIATLPP